MNKTLLNLCVLVSAIPFLAFAMIPSGEKKLTFNQPDAGAKCKIVITLTEPICDIGEDGRPFNIGETPPTSNGTNLTAGYDWNLSEDKNTLTISNYEPCTTQNKKFVIHVEYLGGTPPTGTAVFHAN